MLTAALIYPHQLFRPHPAISGADLTFLVEEPLFFRQYAFHRQKLMFHRATMKRFAHEAKARVRYVESSEIHDTGDIVRIVAAANCTTIRVVDPCDDWLLSRLQAACAPREVALKIIPDPHFLTPESERRAFTAGKQKLFFTDFYIRQRTRLQILLTPAGGPRDGKWSFDADNRKKLPASLRPPVPTYPTEDAFVYEARQYVRTDFPSAPGADGPFRYPISVDSARLWLSEFLEQRFADFGTYEDAISNREQVIFHSVLTPALNVGLLSPHEVVQEALRYDGRIPINSLEGFIRQIIGWREFVRLAYLTRGRAQRTRNFWDNRRPLPTAFYDASTGILPVDHVIRSVLKTGYCHHIERLMILGNFMLLCDIHPDAVYRWFMELFIDAYDWVMVPNVYGMSQFADGGGMTTKPYISGSAYVRKMSNFAKGPWCQIWDALYWRFIDRHANFFSTNPRMAIMVGMKEKLGPKLAEHRRVADEFLTRLYR